MSAAASVGQISGRQKSKRGLKSIVDGSGFMCNGHSALYAAVTRPNSWAERILWRKGGFLEPPAFILKLICPDTHLVGELGLVVVRRGRKRVDGASS